MSNSAFPTPANISAATQSDMETATSTATYVSPGRQQFHPSSPKAWIRYTETTTTAITSSYNITSVADNGTGDTTITFTTSFSGTTYAFVPNCQFDTTGTNYFTDFIKATSIATGSCRFVTHNGTNALDMNICEVAFYGDQ